ISGILLHVEYYIDEVTLVSLMWIHGLLVDMMKHNMSDGKGKPVYDAV
ncbi:25506_t:CDS:1, partial [Racocetra persica]